MKYYVKYSADIELALDEFCNKLKICNLRSQENLMIVFNDLDTTKSAFSEYIVNYKSLDWTKGHTLAHHLHTRPQDIPIRFSDNTKEGYLKLGKNRLSIWHNEDKARDIIVDIIQHPNMKTRIIKHFLKNKKGKFKSEKISNIPNMKNICGITYKDINENMSLYIRTTSTIDCYYVEKGKNKMMEFNIQTGDIEDKIITDLFDYQVEFVLYYEEISKKFWLETTFANII